MNKIASISTDAILKNPLFIELTRRRARLRWVCTAIVVILFIGFIIAVCSFKSALSQQVGNEVVPIGFLLAATLGAVSLAVTGVYVYQANGVFAALNQRLIVEVRP